MNRVRGESWKNNEDVSLCRAMINIGEDGAIGTNQANKKLWERVAILYATLKPENGVERINSLCEAQWRRISPACSKWCQALTKAETAITSGQNATDMELQANSIYRSLNKGKDFAFAHCWAIMHNSLKFSSPINLEDNYSGPSPIYLDGNDVCESPSPSSSHARSIGQKTQKLQKKNKAKISEGCQALANEWKISNEISKREYEAAQAHAREARQCVQRLELDGIMARNISLLPLEEQTYWKKRKRDLLEEMRREEVGTPREETGSQEFSGWDAGYVPTNDWI